MVSSPVLRRRPLYRRKERLRHGHSHGVMPFAVLLDILREHQRHPGQGLGPFIWRHGPEGVATIYDYHLPYRVGIPYAQRMGWSEDTWNIHSYVLNCSSSVLHINGIQWPEKNMSPGYRRVLVDLLQKGCMVPSACLDTWLGDDSRKFCAPELRIRYREDL